MPGADLMNAAATALSAVAVVIGGLVLVLARSPRTALHVLLDLLLAAGLLRLTAAESWRAIAMAAAIVAVRRLVTTGIFASADAAATGVPRPERGT